jgi:biotin transport system substrate-specific component
MVQSSVLPLSLSKPLARTAGVALFALLTAAGAQILIPTAPVPFTLQTFFVLLSGVLLGAKRGAASQTAYLAAGAAGLPVFAGFSGTFLHLLGPTGGYLLAFPVASYAAGLLFHSAPLRRLPAFAAALVAMTAAAAIIFLVGVVQLDIVVFHNWQASFTAGFLQLQWWDAAKIVAAAGVASQLAHRAGK